MRKYYYFIIILFCIMVVSAADFTPQGNISLRDTYGVTGATFVNATLYYGNASQMTGITSSTANSSTWWAGVSGWATTYFQQTGNNLDINETKLNATIDARDDDTTYDNTTGISLVGTTFGHSDTSTQASDDNSGNTFIQDIVLDTFGHITSIVNAGVDFSSYVAIADLVGYVGNWSADKSNYYNTTQTDTEIINANTSMKTYVDSNPGGYSTTTGTVTSVATDDSYLTGGPITSTGTITLNTTLAGTSLATNTSDYWDNLGSPSDIGTGDITDDGTWRLNSWNNLTGIPHATPSNGDTTHFSLADEIHDWVIGLAYLTAETLWNGNFSAATGTGNVVLHTSPTFATGITVPDNSISDEELDEAGTFSWTGAHTWASTGTFNDDLIFMDEIKPDNDVCDNGDILYKTAGDDWDCKTVVEAGAGDMNDLHDDTAPQLGGYLDADGENIGATDDEIENIYVGDTTRIYFGDGQDASIYFNGTNLIISG